MKNFFYFLGLSIAITSCASSCFQKSTTEKVVTTDSVSFYRSKSDSLQLEINDLKDQINMAKDAIRFCEDEVSYWGRKYDSCRVKK